MYILLNLENLFGNLTPLGLMGCPRHWISSSFGFIKREIKKYGCGLCDLSRRFLLLDGMVLIMFLPLENNIWKCLCLLHEKCSLFFLVFLFCFAYK